MDGRQHERTVESDDYRGVSRRRLLQGVGGLGVVGLAGPAAGVRAGGHDRSGAVQQREEGLESFEYVHEMNVNGATSTAEAAGTIDAAAGRIVYEGVIDDYIPGYRYWAGSAVTLAIISGAPAVAAELSGGRNTLTLTEGDLGYGVTVETSDRFADLQTDVRVGRDGGTLLAELRTEGQADYPDLVGMLPVAMRFRQEPTDGGFMETGWC